MTIIEKKGKYIAKISKTDKVSDQIDKTFTKIKLPFSSYPFFVSEDSHGNFAYGKTKREVLNKKTAILYVVRGEYQSETESQGVSLESIKLGFLTIKRAP